MTETESMAREGYNVLLADDSEDDRFFMRRALRLLPELHVVGEVGDGHEAISYLRGTAPFADRAAHPLPDLLILDLKMPRKNGHEVLEWLRANPCGNIAVIAVSGSSLPEDISQSLALGAAAYHQKSSFKEAQETLIGKIKVALGI